jgi:uncharacterized repeat protein (TIGR01451 family)
MVGFLFFQEDDISRLKVRIGYPVPVAALLALLLVLMLFTLVRAASGVWPDCSWGCTANDVTVTRAWLGNATGVELGPCEPGEPNGSAYIWVTIDNNAQAERYAVRLLAQVFVNEHYIQIDQCALDIIAGKTTQDYALYNFTWHCGEAIMLESLIVSWQPNSSSCADPAECPPPSKCSGPVDMKVAAPLVANFYSTSPQCYCTSIGFNDTTTGGEPPYTYWWDFGDGSGNSTEQNPSYHYGAAGSYNVMLQVTDSVSNNDAYQQEAQVITDADLEITKTGFPDLVFPGQTVTYNVTVSNGGPCDAFGVVVTDALPYVLSNPEYSTDDGETWLSYNGTVDLGTLVNGETGQFMLKAAVGCPVICPDEINNTAMVESSSYDPATDNNSASTTTTVSDSTPPVITCAGNVTIECDESTEPYNTGIATATDNCDTDVEVTYSDVSDGGTCLGNITRTWTATDDCGNTDECVQIITVVDSTAPDITSAPGNVTIQCIDDIPPIDIGNVTAIDNCGNVTVTYAGDADDGNTCPKTITRTYQATDECGNSANVTQAITVDDTIAPVITCAGNVTIDCDESTDPSDIGNATATDNCDIDVEVTYSDVSDGGTCSENITRTWSATDDCGNTDECVQIITLFDSTAPDITSAPGNVTVECFSDIPPVDIGNVTATDDCGNVTVTYVGDVDDGNTCPMTITRAYQAADECGNLANVTQTITVDDTIAPVITCAANVTIGYYESSDPSNTGNATATDNCDTDVDITYSDLMTGGFGRQMARGHWGDTETTGEYAEVIERTWTATDDCGNSAQCVQIIIRLDVGGTPIPVTVGGIILPTDKPGLMMPWLIAAVALIALAGVSLVVWSRRQGSPRGSL